jgi:hypothetical protein
MVVNSSDSVLYVLEPVARVEVCRERVRVLHGGREIGKSVVLIVGVLVVLFPLWILLVSSPLRMMLLRGCRLCRRYRSWMWCKLIRGSVVGRGMRLGRRM